MPHFTLNPRGPGKAADISAVADPTNRRESAKERIAREIEEQNRARTHRPAPPAPPAGEKDSAPPPPPPPSEEATAGLAAEVAKGLSEALDAEDPELQAELDALEAELEAEDEENVPERFLCPHEGCEFPGASSERGLKAHIRAKHPE